MSEKDSDGVEVSIGHDPSVSDFVKNKMLRQEILDLKYKVTFTGDQHKFFQEKMNNRLDGMIQYLIDLQSNS